MLGRLSAYYFDVKFDNSSRIYASAMVASILHLFTFGLRDLFLSLN